MKLKHIVCKYSEDVDDFVNDNPNYQIVSITATDKNRNQQGYIIWYYEAQCKDAKEELIGFNIPTKASRDIIEFRYQLLEKLYPVNKETGKSQNISDEEQRFLEKLLNDYNKHFGDRGYDLDYDNLLLSIKR
jgi:hypothetical protein